MFFFPYNLVFRVCLAVGYVGILQCYEVSLRTAIGLMERETITYPMYITPVYFVFILLNTPHTIFKCIVSMLCVSYAMSS